ncbi:TorD/DmsD family molecular chaperone [Ferrimonas gelatinilytica]|uniref:Tat proofreading chaperone DmsD n=1 Tax=Ferrimonas gelatinilytica TaxID=1255257 RepID=A0ABP9RU35_9GAMM
MRDLFPYAAAACGVLHNVFYPKPNPAFLAELTDSGLLAQWPGFGQDPADAVASILDSLKQDDFDAIERDYYQLFVGPGGMAAYPWGSVYTDKENLVFGDTTLAWQQFCQQQGLTFELDHNEPQDHIGLILAVLSQLFEQGDETAIMTLLSDHLLPWSHRFTEAVTTQAHTGFYRGFGQLTALLLADWQQRLEVTPAPLTLYR